jgi:hypothetical protein
MENLNHIHKKCTETTKEKPVQSKNGQRTRRDISPLTHKWPRAYEKILNIMSHQGNANQNHSDVSLHTR